MTTQKRIERLNIVSNDLYLKCVEDIDFIDINSLSPTKWLNNREKIRKNWEDYTLKIHKTDTNARLYTYMNFMNTNYK
jgi:hypothetical protein